MTHKIFALTSAVAMLVMPFTTASAIENPFKDIHTYPTQTQQDILHLVEQKVITGTSPTTFSPTAEITRGQVVKMLGRFLVNNEIVAVPSDWETKKYFKDLSLQSKDRELLKYAAVVKSSGVFVGKPGELLDPAGKITRENMALVLDRATSAMRGKSLVEIAYYEEDNVSDLDEAREETQSAIRALNALGISNVKEYNPKAIVKRVHFASFLSRAMDFMAPRYTHSEFTIEAEDYGFASFTEITNLEETDLDVEFTSTEITVSGDFAQDEIDWFFDWVDIEGTNLFGSEHFASIDFELNENAELSPTIDFYDMAESIPAKAFLMDDFTSVTSKSVNGSTQTKTENYTNNRVFYKVNKTSAVNEMMELTITGTKNSQPVNDTIQYYIDFAGNIVLDQNAQNFTTDYRYEISQSGDVLKNGKFLQGKTFYYLPARSSYDWDVAAFQNEATIEEILAFHNTNGTKENFNFSNGSEVLVIDQQKNVYGVLDLAGNNEFFDKYTFEIQAPFDLSNSDITAMGNIVFEKQSNTRLLATVVGDDALDTIVMIFDDRGNERYYYIEKIAKSYKFVEITEDELMFYSASK